MDIIFILTCFFVSILFFSFLSIVYWSLRNGIVPMPTASKVKRALFEQALPKEVPGIIYELGSGWGTLAFPLAKHYPRHQIFACESSIVPYAVSKIAALFMRRKNLFLLRKDFFKINLNDGGLIICYLYPEAMRKLKEKFKNELKPGALILTHTFAIPGWEPSRVYIVNDLYHTKIYLYKI